eukprot:3761831-Pyramimonas_sp.AAC.1
MRAQPLGPSVELPMKPRNVIISGGDARVRTPPLGGACGEAPYGATRRCTGLGKRIRTPPHGPSVELLMGPRSAILGRRNSCVQRHWRL